MVFQENPHTKSESKTKRKTPAICIFTKKQALLNIPTTNISALNIEEIESSNAEDAFVATIRSICAIAFPVMDARPRQMREPPQKQKEDQQQTIHTIQRTNMTAFPVPSSAFAILKGGFHPPAEPIVGNAPFPRSPIRNHDQRFFFCRIPKDSQFRFNRLVLPQTHRAMKALPWLTHQLGDGSTRTKLSLGRPTLAGMLSCN